MRRSRPRRGFGWKLFAVLIVVALALWCGYWFASNRIVTLAFARATESLAARGRDVACTQNAVSGFPLSLDLDCSGAVFNDRNAGISVALSRFTATAPLYWPGRVNAVVASPLTIEAPGLGISLAASWSNATTRVDAGFSGLNGGAMSVDQLDLSPGEGKLRLPLIHLAAAHAAATAAPASGNAYRFELAADDVVVKPKKGKELPAFATTLDLTALDFGGSLGTDPGKAIAAWLQAGGALRIDDASIAVGETSARTSGTVTVSADGLISGQLTVRLAGLDKFPALAEELKPGSKDKAAQAVAMIVALGKPAHDDPDAREVPLVIRDGEVTVSVFKVATIPPLRF